MSVAVLEDTTKKIMAIVNKFGRMTLDEAKDFYQSENATYYPLGKDYDETVNHFLIEFGVKASEENGKVVYGENSEDSLKRKLPSPVDNNVIRKRSKSTSGMGDEEKENDDMRTRGRVGRRVAFKDGASSPVEVSGRSKSEHRPQQKHYPKFENCVLVGDDLIIGYVKFNLGEELPRVDGKLQSGLCISNLTIAMATKELMKIDEPPFTRILVYLGSVDILHNRELVQMMFDFDEFLEVCQEKKIRAVACTLAPVVVKGEYRKEVLDGFNKYLKTQANISVIDVHSAFVAGKKPNAPCYCGDIKNINQRTQIKFWTNRGRSNFAQIIMCNLGFALLDDKPAVHARKLAH